MSKAIGAERPAADRSRSGWKPMAFGGRAAQRAAPEAPDPASVPWYRIGGIAALALALGYLATIVLFARVGAPPKGGGEAWMRYLPGKTGQWWAILALSVVTDLLYIPVAFALFLALKRISRNAMLIAVALTGLFVVLDLAVTWTNYAALITLGGNYANTANAAQRASDTVAAGYPAAVVGSRLESVYAIVVLSSAILIVGLVMMRGVFNRGTAYVGVLTGALGILAPFGWTLIVILNAIGATAWIVLVSYRLARLGWERRWRSGRLFTLICLEKTREAVGYGLRPSAKSDLITSLHGIVAQDFDPADSPARPVRWVRSVVGGHPRHVANLPLPGQGWR